MEHENVNDYKEIICSIQCNALLKENQTLKQQIIILVGHVNRLCQKNENHM